MIKYLFLIFVALSTNCAPNLSNHHWKDWQPYVVDYSPFSGIVLSDTKQKLFFKFSQPLDSASVTSKSIFMIKKSEFELYKSDWKNLVSAVESVDLSSLELSFDLSKDALSLSVQIIASVTDASQYVLVITPLVLSQNKAPFDQSLSSGDVAYFMTEYNLIATQENENQSSSIVIEDELPQNQSDSVNLDPQEIPIADETGYDEVTETETNPQNTSTVFNSVLITEIVTDPQQDFNDTSGGDGVMFNIHTGVGTVGSTDEYIELYNPTSDAINLTGYALNMMDETPELQVLSDTTWTEFLFSGESGFDAFLPGDFLVLGNPIGSINNGLTVELLDANQTVLQTVFLEDGNADDFSNESYTLDLSTNEWAQTEASPGF